MFLFLKCWLPTSFTLSLLHTHWSTSSLWQEVHKGLPGLAEWAAGMRPASESQSLLYPFVAACWEMNVYNLEREWGEKNQEINTKISLQVLSTNTYYTGFNVTYLSFQSVWNVPTKHKYWHISKHTKKATEVKSVDKH